MKGKILCALLVSLLVSGCGDNNTPPDNVLKEQFSNQFRGLLTLDSINVKETSVDGNKRTYSADGSLLSSYDLYTTVASLTDYVVVKKSWNKEKDIKFSSTLNSVGNKDTGWKTRFSSLQMSETPEGNPIQNIETDGKYIVMGGSGFDNKIDSIRKEYAEKKKTSDDLKKDRLKFEADILSVQTEIDIYWGRDEEGSPLNRYTVQRNLNKVRSDFDKANAPYFFERKYNQDIFEPAMKAREEKLRSYKMSDFDDIRAEKRAALQKHRDEYSAKSKEIDEQIKNKMKTLDDGLQILIAKKRGLEHQYTAISDEIRNLDYQYENWLQFMDNLQKSK